MFLIQISFPYYYFSYLETWQLNLLNFPFIWIKVCRQCFRVWVYMNCVADSFEFLIQYSLSHFSILTKPQSFSRRQCVQVKKWYLPARNDKVICMWVITFSGNRFWNRQQHLSSLPLPSCLEQSQCPEMEQLSWEHNQSHT